MLAGALAVVQEGEAAGSAGPFTINGGLILWTLVIFGILLYGLAKWGWPAILKQVEEREAKIRQSLDEAAKANAEAQRLLAEYQAQMAKARADAQDLLAQGRQAGEQLREELIGKGRAEQEELLERARREIALERDKALAELRREAVDLSIAAASKVLERNIDTEADRKLVQDYLGSLHVGKS